MKKIFLTVVLLLAITGVSLFAWEPIDLTKYPSFTEPGDWILNLGVGFNGIGGFDWGKDKIWIPPVHLAFDCNVPLGDNGLPFFFGGLVGYWGRGFKGNALQAKHYWSALDLGFRFGYHFNWDVDKLDTYAVTTAGWTVYMGDYKGHTNSDIGWPNIGISLGVRFFPIDWFGFWAEVGSGTNLFNADIGISFKF